MARAAKFAPPVEDPRSVLSHFSYAYQFDAGLFARRLRTLGESLGVVRREGRIEGVDRDGETVQREEFVARRIGHDTARTRYSVERPAVEREARTDLGRDAQRAVVPSSSQGANARLVVPSSWRVVTSEPPRSSSAR